VVGVVVGFLVGVVVHVPSTLQSTGVGVVHPSEDCSHGVVVGGIVVGGSLHPSGD